jgi:hypothetical protein
MLARRLAAIALCTFALDTIDLPDDPNAVEDVPAAFQRELDGLERSDVSPTQVSYGDGSTFVRAMTWPRRRPRGSPVRASEAVAAPA